MSTKWQAPGGGRWDQDAEHLSAPITPYFFATVKSMLDGQADGMRRYGIPLAGFDVRLVAGRIYGRVRPVGAPDPDRVRSARGQPPRLLFRILFALHPELRRRTRAAEKALRSRLWREDARHWREELEPSMRARNVQLARIDPATLDDSALAAHIDRLQGVFAEGFRLHGQLAPVHGIPLGRWLRRTVEWTGVPAGRTLEVLKGESPASAAGVASIDRIAAAVRDTPGAADILRANQTADDRSRRLREASPGVGAALDAYLEEDGYRPITGLDIVDQTARELPGLLLESVSARLETSPEASGDQRTDAADRLRDRVPSEHRAEYDELLADARETFGTRDSDVWVTTQWPQGILRHALLEAARRLQARGAIEHVDSVFDSVPGEISALLRGADAPSANVLARRTEERLGWAKETPPLFFGEAGEPPSADAFPPAVAELTSAMMFLFGIDAAEGAGHPIASEPTVVRGLGVSTGEYRGRARVVLGPADFARLERGDVLVARTTSPAYNILLPLIGAVVTDRGGLLSHAALVAREFGIPAVVGTTDATSRIADGATVTVDAEAGLVFVG